MKNVFEICPIQLLRYGCLFSATVSPTLPVPNGFITLPSKLVISVKTSPIKIPYKTNPKTSAIPALIISEYSDNFPLSKL